MIESRKTPRRPVVQGAWIFAGGGSSLIPCMMVDLSVAGARLKLDANTQLPTDFILVLSRDGRLNRRCRTVWRRDDTVGVKFLAAQSVTPKAKPAKPRGFSIQVPEGAWPDDDSIVQIADAPALVPERQE